MKSKTFDNKIVLVTGGSSGIGNEIARQYASAGAKVFLADIQPAKRDFSFEFIYTDVSSPESISNLFHEIRQRADHLDILINNAGISEFHSFEQLTVELWDKVINTNLRSIFLCSQSALPLMKKNGGSIVNMASIRAFMSEADTEAYSASKGGVVSLTHALAVTLSSYNIQVNSISPGWISTGNYDALTPEDHKQHLSNRVGKPSDIAQACLYLTTPGNNFINGTNINIDGGMTVKMNYYDE